MTFATTRRPMTRADRAGVKMKRSVAVQLSEFSRHILAEGDRDGEDVAARLEQAVRVYLHDRESAQPGWSIPSRLSDRRSSETELRVEVDESLWLELEGEAAEQGVSVSQMAAQAILYYAAELDSGRITKRILDDLDAGDA